MALRLIRESSETPNITNKDDAKMIRYAYGDYNGVVKDYGSGLAVSTSNGRFFIGSGRIVFQGWEIELDANGWWFEPSVGTGTRYYTVYLKLNLTLEQAQIRTLSSFTDYPEIELGDDLTTYPNGIARLPLYRVRYVNNSVDFYESLIINIPYTKELLQVTTEQLDKKVNNLRASISNGSVISRVALYADRDESKGTIEERLSSGLIKTIPVTSSNTIPITEPGIYILSHSLYSYPSTSYYTETLCIFDLSTNVLVSGSSEIRYDSSKQAIISSADNRTLHTAYMIASFIPFGTPTAVQLGDELRGGGSLERVFLELWRINGAELKEGDKLVHGGEEAEIYGYEDGMYDLSCITNGWFHSNKNSELSGLYLNGVLTIK